MMQEAVQSRPPVHLWIVGILALLWNLIGVADYLISRLRLTDVMAQMMPNVDPQVLLAWVDSFPIWAQIGWGLGVWGGLAGSLLLLMRSRYAFHAFGLSFVGIILGIGYQLVASPPPGEAGEGMGAVMPYAVILVGAALLIYARGMEAKRVLR